MNKENGNAILSGLANLAGYGKYAAIEKENKELRDSVPRKLEELQKQYTQEVEKAVMDRTEAMSEENC